MSSRQALRTTSLDPNTIEGIFEVKLHQHMVEGDVMEEGSHTMDSSFSTQLIVPNPSCRGAGYSFTQSDTPLHPTLATKRRNVDPMAIGRTPPSILFSARRLVPKKRGRAASSTTSIYIHANTHTHIYCTYVHMGSLITCSILS